MMPAPKSVLIVRPLSVLLFYPESAWVNILNYWMMKQKRFLTALLAGLLGLCGCAHLHPARHASTPSPLTVIEQKHEPDPKPATLICREQEVQVQRNYKLKRITIDTETNQGNPGEAIVLDYYQCKKEPSAVILLLPVSGGNYEIEHHFARYLAKHGLAVVLAYRPTNAAPELSDLGAINTWLEQSVSRGKRALDWIEDRPELDPDRVGVFGISMGAIQGVLLTAADPRIRAEVFGLVGGDLPYILCHSAEPGITRRRKSFLQKHNLTEPQLHDELKKTITCEPNTAAARIDPQDALVVLGAFDRVVPFKKGLELRRQMGRPETIILPTGHYSALVCIPYLKHQTLKFFQTRFSDE